MGTGVVKWFNAEKGYGFIVPDDGTADLFVHQSEIQVAGYRSLNEGQRVQLEDAGGRQGASGGSGTHRRGLVSLRMPIPHRGESKSPLCTVAINRKILVALAVAVVALLVTAAAQMPAGASTPTSTKSLAKDLLTSSYPKKAGFTKMAVKASTTSKTGLKACPDVDKRRLKVLRAKPAWYRR